MGKRTITIAMIFWLGAPLPTNASQADADHRLARRAANDKQYDLSYMYYRSLSRQKDSFPYADKSFFAQGEYCYMNKLFTEARQAFERYLNLSLTPDQRLLALAYLLKLAQLQEDTERATEVEDQIIASRPQSFIFKDQKEYVSTSPLRRQHKIIYTIDKVEFYVEGVLFAEVNYGG